MDLDKVECIQATCFICNTRIEVKEAKFQEIASAGLTCPVCNDSIPNVKLAALKIFEYNKSVDELYDSLDTYENIRIF